MGWGMEAKDRGWGIRVTGLRMGAVGWGLGETGRDRPLAMGETGGDWAERVVESGLETGENRMGEAWGEWACPYGGE